MRKYAMENQGDITDARLGRHLFILRRATWMGAATAPDVIRAFGVSRITAVLDLKDAAAHWTITDPKGVPIPALRKERGKVRPARPDLVHPDAAPDVVLELLANNAPPHVTGLFETETPVSLPRKTWLAACGKDSLAAILGAMLAVKGRKQASLRMEYVGLKLNDKFRERWVCPLELRVDGPIARLTAVDLDDMKFRTKSFVLTRIRNARISDEPFPKDFRFAPYTLPEPDRLRVEWDPRLTPDQKAVMMAELGIDHQNIWTVAAYESFVRRRIYTSNQPVLESDLRSVWPRIIFCDKIKSQ